MAGRLSQAVILREDPVAIPSVMFTHSNGLASCHCSSRLGSSARGSATARVHDATAPRSPTTIDTSAEHDGGDAGEPHTGRAGASSCDSSGPDAIGARCASSHVASHASGSGSPDASEFRSQRPKLPRADRHLWECIVRSTQHMLLQSPFLLERAPWGL